MARNPGVKTRAGRPAPARPAPKPLAVSPAAVPAAAPPAKKRSLGETINGLPRFAADVRQEARKVTWPSWKETWITSVMVFIMVTVTAVFFLLTDGTLSFLTQQFLKLAG